ncbi:MAG: right-handed parallel beta-helix repeat-containing protein [Planctomycetota bacterium]
MCPFRAAVVWVVSAAACASAAEWFVTPDGKPANAGTKEAPWELGFALQGGGNKVAPGDTLWLGGGVYKFPFTKGKPSYGFEVKLAGAAEHPICVRGAKGERATIDGGLTVNAPSTYLWLQDLEITASEPRPDKVLGPIAKAKEAPLEADIQQYRPWSGLNVYSGEGCKFINLVIHDNCQGVSWWQASKDSEVYGCLIYNNGWAATDRGHGHCIYTQNREGVKTVSNCILSSMFNGTYTLHAYGSKNAYVDNYVAEENIVYDKGPFLIGGGRPSHNIVSRRNCLYGVPMRIGYDAPENEDCEVRDNVIVNSELQITKYKKAVNEGNVIIGKNDKRPAEPRTVFLPNKYDPGRAHVAVCNFAHVPQVPVQMAQFLKAGDKVRLLDPRDFYGKPVWEGTAAAETLDVPTPGEFAVYVVLKGL